MRKGTLPRILRRPWVRWLAAVVVLAGAGYGYQMYRARAEAGKLPAGVQTAKVKRGDLEERISATGVVSAQTGAQVKIGSQLSGRIKRLVADVGQHVRAGDAIAELDLPEVEAQYLQAANNLEQAKTRVEQAKLNVQLTDEQTVAEVRSAEAALAAAGARVSSTRAAAEWQPEQTKADIARAQASLATAHSLRAQVEASVKSQLNQATTTVDRERSEAENLQRQYARGLTLSQRGYVATEVLDNVRTQLEQARKRLEAARANYTIVEEKTKADLRTAKDACDQADATLAAAKAGTMQDRVRAAEAENAEKALSQSSAQLELARANRRQQAIRRQSVREAEAAVRVAQNSLQIQAAQRAKIIIRTPISGTVLSIAAQQGETVAAAFAAPTLIIVADLNRLEVKAYVDENDIGKVKLNLPVSVVVDALREHSFRGRVTKISAASTIKDNVVTYETIVSIDNPGGLLKPDMTTAVEILLEKRPDVLTVPSESVKRIGERQVVYVLPPGATKPSERKVTTGLDSGAEVEIKSGLQAGETVVVAGLDKFGIQTGFTVRR